MRIAVAASLLLAFSALPAMARPGCGYRGGDPDAPGSRARSARCGPYRAIGEPGTTVREAPPRPRPWALPRGRDSLPMPGPF